MSLGSSPKGDGQGVGVAVAVGVTEAVAVGAEWPGEAAGAVGTGDGVVPGAGEAAGHGEPGGRHGLSGVGWAPSAQGAPAGPMTLPVAAGAWNVSTLVPLSAAFMNFCQMVAGSVPPVTWIPWTFVIAGVWPEAGLVR